jgi:phospholipase C
MRLGSGLLGAVLAALLGAGCGAGRGSAHELAPDAGVPVLDAGHSSAYAPTVEPPGPDGDSDDTDDVPFAAKRAACSFKQGALPKETFGPSIADGNFPIDTIVIVTQENRSFDEYLSQLPAAGQPDANVEDPNVSLSNATGQSYYPFHENAFCVDDPPHDWNSMHQDWDNGKNDGFLRVDGPSNYPTLGYYDRNDLGFYYGLATTYAVSDSYFAAVLGPTGPNRMYLYAGTSAGHLVNTATLPSSQPTIFQRLKDAHVSFGVYSNADPPAPGSPPPPCPGPASFETSMFCSQTGPAKTFAQFQADAQAGTLPHVVWVFAGNDEHPIEDIQQGEADVQGVYTALANSPQWIRSAFILTYDESGGFYDHVAPPPACLPDAIAPNIPKEGTTPGKFDVYGFRVPFFLASPYAKPHYVSHVVDSHTSILRFLELRFGLPACSDRDANADPLLDLFDFTHPSFPQPAVFPLVILADPTTRGC